MNSIIITGASRGIGRAAALLLSKEYDYLAIAGRNSALLEDTAELVRANGAICHTFCGDVSDYAFSEVMTSSVLSEAGHIDALINNAGISMVGLFTDMTPDQWHKILDVNLTSMYNTCHNAVPAMVQRKSGRIINISSVWGLTGASCEVAYSATKSAINGFTKALAKELAPSHIAVNAIAFGAVDTDMNSHLNAEDKSMLEDDIPYGKMATPEEAAICIKNILSMPEYMTGDVIKFDGGWV